jgi:hypothetical protein
MAASGSAISHVDEDQSVIKGEDRIIHIDVTDANNARVNMTGYTLTWRLEDITGANAITKGTGGSGIALSSSLGDATLDRAIITLAAGDTSSLAAGRCSHYLRRTDSGQNRVLARGEFHLLDI